VAPAPFLLERFETPSLDPRLRWWNPPPRAEAGGSRLLVATRAGTDFWQGTHYGFRVDNGHCLFCEVSGDFVMETTLRLDPVHQYDQAGLMVRLSEACWLKTSIEHEPEGPSRLGAVVTNAGWSDWSTQDWDPALRAVSLRIRREGADYIVDHARIAAPGAARAWSQIRMARLHEDDGTGHALQAGLYACSPKGEGFTAEFDYLEVMQGRIGMGEGA